MSASHRVAARLILALSVLAAGTLLSACEGFVTYTVVNDTGQDLLTWPSDRSCDASVGKRDDYLASHVVPMHQKYDYLGNVGASGPDMRCVYVATADRRVVQVEPYVDDGVVTVREPLNAGAVFPQRDDLPSKSYVDRLRDMPPSGWVLFIAGVVSVIAIAVAFGFAAFQITRSIRRKEFFP